MKYLGSVLLGNVEKNRQNFKEKLRENKMKPRAA